jgi:hypothetical protein
LRQRPGAGVSRGKQKLRGHSPSGSPGKAGSVDLGLQGGGPLSTQLLPELPRSAGNPVVAEPEFPGRGASRGRTNRPAPRRSPPRISRTTSTQPPLPMRRRCLGQRRRRGDYLGTRI